MQAEGSKRGTGRTTRMMEAAAELSAAGRAVLVVMEGKRQAEGWARRLGPSSAVVVLTPDRMRGPHPADWVQDARRDGIEILVDHFVIESRLGPVLALLTRFDAPPKPLEELAR